MTTERLSVEISEELYKKFFTTVTEKGGRWRSKRRKETALKAYRSAVEVALIKFLEDLEKPAEGAKEEKEFLEKIGSQLCAIRGQAGEIMKRIREMEEKVTGYEHRHEPSLFDERG